MNKRIVISGYYGCGNIGDEAVLSGILAGMAELGIEADVTVLSSNPGRTESDHPGTKSVHRFNPAAVAGAIRRADLVISGGGSLVQDVTSARSARYYLGVLRLAQLMGRRTMVCAQGIGPLVRQSTRKAAAKALNQTAAITVRDEESRLLLEALGVNKVPAQVAADPSFLVTADYDSADRALAGLGLSADEDLIGVSLRPWPKAESALAEAAAGIAESCAKLGARCLLFPMQEPADVPVCEAVSGGLTARGIRDVRTVKGLVGRCCLVVGMRLHSLMFAASEAVPFVALSYDPKVSSFTSQAGLDNVLEVGSWDRQSVCDAVNSAWRNRLSEKAGLERKAQELRASALESIKLIRELLSVGR